MSNAPADVLRPLGGAHHYGYVVESIEATVERLAEQLGAGPFFLVENVPAIRSEDADGVVTFRVHLLRPAARP